MLFPDIVFKRVHHSESLVHALCCVNSNPYVTFTSLVYSSQRGDKGDELQRESEEKEATKRELFSLDGHALQALLGQPCE